MTARCLAVGDRDDRVVERRVHVRDAVRHDFLIFLRARCCAAICCGEGFFAMDYVPFFSDTPALRGPLRVRAFVRVRWPRTGSPRRCRTPR